MGNKLAVTFFLGTLTLAIIFGVLAILGPTQAQFQSQMPSTGVSGEDMSTALLLIGIFIGIPAIKVVVIDRLMGKEPKTFGQALLEILGMSFKIISVTFLVVGTIIMGILNGITRSSD